MIGRTNAITISGGGTTKTDYELWQEGFNANWDSVIQNAPQSGNEPCLFIYNKVNEIIFNVGNFNAVTYNPTTGIYRPIAISSNNKLVFNSSDFFINNYDGNEYVCIVFKTINISWGPTAFNKGSSLVYANTKYCNSTNKDRYINPLSSDASHSPLLRGVDGYSPNTIIIGGCLEHLTLREYATNISLSLSATGDTSSIAGDTQIKLIKNIVDNAPITTTFNIVEPHSLMYAIISDRKLSDWFYNDYFYKSFNGTAYGSNAGAQTKKTYKFKVNSNILLTGSFQLNYLPDCVYLDGTFTENQLNDAAAGLHRGFQTHLYISLKNFPMWTVLEGATTGCLLPMTTTNTNNYQLGSFLFYSTNLEAKYFCEFDENGIIKDPTKYFICNLPIEINTHTNIYVRFADLKFKDNYTSAQQSAIQNYLNAKKWNLIW